LSWRQRARPSTTLHEIQICRSRLEYFVCITAGGGPQLRTRSGLGLSRAKNHALAAAGSYLDSDIYREIIPNLAPYCGMNKILLAAVLFFLPSVIFAQEKTTRPPEGSDWHKVEVLPVGTPIYITVQKHTTRCVLMSVGVDSVTCNNGKDSVFQRAEIKTIKVSHHTRSTLVGLGLGWVAADVMGVVALDKMSGSGAAAVATAGVAVLIAAPIIGYKTDFTRSTIYVGN